MPASKSLVWLVVLLAVLPAPDVAAGSTVCTITVNSPDEREVLRRKLPEARYQFVELVEKGRADWLESACRRKVRCDVLVISGHFDAGTEFYSDRFDARESLPVDEMERASCSASCSGLFSQLKEVYLFGCNTLNAVTPDATAGEVARSLLRAGRSPADAGRIARSLNERHGESNRDSMRRIFAGVPVIYGFSAMAPLGAKAAPILDRYLDATAGSEIGSGRISNSLLGYFSATSMVATSGLGESDPRADTRRDVCRFFDPEQAVAQKLAFVHQLLGRDMAEVRMLFERIEKFMASLTEADRRSPSSVRELASIAGDHVARERYLAFADGVDRPAVRARMLRVARGLGWLSAADERAEFARLAIDLATAAEPGPADVELVCALNEQHALDDALFDLPVASTEGNVAHAALLACLGHAAARPRVLAALTGSTERDVEVAQVYLRHRPLADGDELRAVVARVAAMTEPEAQVRALDTLAHYYLADRPSLEALTELFPRVRSVEVQRAIAGVLIRADYGVLARGDLVRVLREHRLKRQGGEDMIDALIRRLQA
ncbi:MAG TPA: hypothetical protein VJQ49_10985 [Casimicrobiaceae bacterium]|nr:hypothetical protein [Casimicrobiaceae bacterium]